MKIFRHFCITLLCLMLLVGNQTVWAEYIANRSFDTADTMRLNSSIEFYSSATSDGYYTAYYRFDMPVKGRITIKVNFVCTKKGGGYDDVFTGTLWTAEKNDISESVCRFSDSQVGAAKSISLTQELGRGTYYFSLDPYVWLGPMGVFSIKISNTFTCLHEDTYVKNVVYSTCSGEGRKEIFCKYCGAQVRVETIDKLPHKLPTEWETVSEPTCAKEGQRVKKCLTCGQVVESETLERPEHTFGEWEIARETTCSEAGQQKRTCSVCGFEETQPIEALPHTFGDWKITVSPTCADEGERQRACTVCGHTEKEAVERLDHQFGKWETVRSASCTEQGQRSRKCGVCGEEQTELLDMTQHVYSSWKTVTEPTCQREGKRERICSVCGDKQTETLPVAEHAFGEWVTTAKATEGSTGSQSRTCRYCSKKETRSIPRLIHGESYEWEVTQTPTCEKTGVKTKICDYCGKSVTTETIPKTEHNWSNWQTVKEAKYRQDGEQKRTCRQCGVSETRTVAYEIPGGKAFKTYRSYGNTFTDVPQDSWYHSYVKTAYEYQLVNGVNASGFAPDSKFTVAQVLTVAANLHTAYYGTSVRQTTAGEAWYMPYVDYCKEQKIISEGQFDDYTRNITRGEMAMVFASLLPDSEYAGGITGSAPDVKSNMPCASAVSKLFKAGIVGGDAGTGNYRPNDEIKRSEACVIFTRIAVPAFRITK